MTAKARAGMKGHRPRAVVVDELADPPIRQRLKVSEVAAVLKEHPQTTYLRLRSGQLKGVQHTPGGRWFVRPEDLEAFLNPPAPKRRGQS